MTSSYRKSMRNLHSGFTKKILHVFLLSFLIASPSTAAAACPKGYQEIKEYDDYVVKVAVLGLHERFSKELLEKCTKTEQFVYRCGNYNFAGHNMEDPNWMAIISKTRSLQVDMERTLNDEDWKTLGVGVYGGYAGGSTPDKEWCETEKKDTVLCHRTYSVRDLYYNNNIDKKLIKERDYRFTKRCALVDF